MVKKILYFALLPAGLIAIGYFIGHSISSENENREVFSMQQKCGEVGAKLYEEDLEWVKPTSSLGSPEYHYNKELNTCLYYNTLIEGGGNSQKWVKDSFSNKDLVLFIGINGEPFLHKSCDVCVTIEEFNIKKEALFSK